MFLLYSPAALLRKRWKAIVFFGILTSVLAAGISLLFPLEYRADAEVLIISKSRNGVDPYTTVKSAERIGENLIQIVKTDDFYQKVKENNPSNVDWSRFEGIQVSERTKRRLWQRAIDTSVAYGTGVVHVSAYGTKPDGAKALAEAAVDTLATRGWEYVGGDVIIKVVNRPIVTRWPVRPNLFINTLLGFLFGTVLVGLLVWRREV